MDTFSEPGNNFLPSIPAGSGRRAPACLSRSPPPRKRDRFRIVYWQLQGEIAAATSGVVKRRLLDSVGRRSRVASLAPDVTRPSGSNQLPTAGGEAAASRSDRRRIRCRAKIDIRKLIAQPYHRFYRRRRQHGPNIHRRRIRNVQYTHWPYAHDDL